MDESFRTTTNGKGPFNPRDQCEKAFHDHDKDQCCGLYPNRYPYDSNFRECCQTGKFHNFRNSANFFISGTEGLEIFGLFPKGDCDAVAGGRVVVSVEGDPSKYSFV